MWKNVCAAIFGLMLCGPPPFSGAFAGENGARPEPAEKAEKAEPGERRLDAAGQKAVLAKIKATFRQHPCVRARVEKRVEDTLGLMPTREYGELLIKRPGKILRRFVKNGKSFKAFLLSGQQSKTFNPALRQVVVKDYSRAPKRLKLIRTGGTGDLDTLQQYYDVTVFEKPGPKGKQWRLVLHRRSGPLPYKRLQARIAEGQPLFSEIKYEYRSEADGNNKVEIFRAIKAVKDIPDREFNDPLFASPKAPIEFAKELEAK